MVTVIRFPLHDTEKDAPGQTSLARAAPSYHCSSLHASNPAMAGGAASKSLRARTVAHETTTMIPRLIIVIFVERT